jgi:hypothetical protein
LSFGAIRGLVEKEGGGGKNFDFRKVFCGILYV